TRRERALYARAPQLSASAADQVEAQTEKFLPHEPAHPAVGLKKVLSISAHNKSPPNVIVSHCPEFWTLRRHGGTMDTNNRTIFDRRQLLRTGGAALAAATVGPLMVTKRMGAQARTVFVNTWGGSWTAAEEAAFFKPFTEATGIRVHTVAP